MNSKPSKSAKKREYHALQNLGEQLLQLNVEQLREIDLDDALLDAVIAAKSIHAHGALRRQKQLIGKLMRQIDPEPVAAALARFKDDGRLEKNAFRLAEQWRDRLTKDGRAGIAAFKSEFGGDCPALSTSVKEWFAARDDKERRVASRKIFRVVHKEILSKLQKQTNSI